MSAVGSSDSYGAPPPQHYGNAPGPGGGDDRLDKAKKVQQVGRLNLNISHQLMFTIAP